MSKQPNRLYIETGDRDLYNSLEGREPLKGLSHVNVFCIAMAFGFKEGIKTPIKKKDGFIMHSTMRESDWRLIKAVAIADTGNLGIAADIGQCGSIAEEYANTGLHLIRGLVESTATGELETTIERMIMTRYNESIREQERKNKALVKAKAGKSVVGELLEKGEGQKIEFKSSLRWNYQNDIKENYLETIIAKSIVGFMNARGGQLVIGISDDKKILGLDKDYATCKKNDRDGFELRLRDVIDEFIGVEYGNLIDVEFESIEGKEVCIVKISESPRPVYLQMKDKSTEFILRDGNRTVKLDPKKIEEYRKSRWK
jgi:hypothetical protein